MAPAFFNAKSAGGESYWPGTYARISCGTSQREKSAGNAGIAWAWLFSGSKMLLSRDPVLGRRRICRGRSFFCVGVDENGLHMASSPW